MSNEKTTLADAQPGGRVRLEPEPRDHRWDDVGERCLDCGDKDWIGGACSGPRAPEISAPWSPIGSAPNDGRPHIRGLWVTSRVDGKPDTREWRQFIGLVNDDGAFVDPDYGETFGWEADQFEAWMPVADAPGAALSAHPSPGGQGDGVSISDDDRAVLQRLQDALPTAGINGWAKGVDVLERLLRESLAARHPVETQLGYTLSDVHEAYSRGKRDAARQPVGSEYIVSGTMEDAEAASDGMLPAALVPVADEWYRLCERRFAVDRIRISGQLAEAIVEAVCAAAPAQAVDLGQFREAVECLKSTIEDGIADAKHMLIATDALDSDLAEADRLLALIDSKAVGK